MSTLYDDYSVWKGWASTPFMDLNEADAPYYETEFFDLVLTGKNVLELGFGNGEFLAWAGSKGAALHGTEISAELVERAKHCGIKVLSSNLAQEADKFEGYFDLIVAFDVLEHLSTDAIAELLSATARLLRPGGIFLMRFPNGQSPFGRVHQHADLTHVTTLSCWAVRQLITNLPFRILRAGDAAYVTRGHGLVRASKIVRNAVRRALEEFVKRLYNFDVPFGVNVVVLLEKQK